MSCWESNQTSQSHTYFPAPQIVLFKAITHLFNVIETESHLIPVLSRGLPKTAGAAKPVISLPTTARTQRAAVQRQSQCRSSQMMMASIWVSLGQALKFLPWYFNFEPALGRFPAQLIPWANSPQAAQGMFCFSVLCVCCFCLITRTSQLLARLEKYSDVPINT